MTPIDPIPTKPERALLAFMGLTTLGFGAAYMAVPLHWAAESSLAIVRPVALGELRGYYAGLQMAMGALFFSGLRSPAWATTGLRAASVLFAGNGIGRIIGCLTAGTIDSYNLSGVVFEIGFSATAIWLLRQRHLRSQES